MTLTIIRQPDVPLAACTKFGVLVCHFKSHFPDISYQACGNFCFLFPPPPKKEMKKHQKKGPFFFSKDLLLFFTKTMLFLYKY